MLLPFPSCIPELGLFGRFPELRRLHREHGGITTPCEQSVLEACGEIALEIHDYEISSQEKADVYAWIDRLEKLQSFTPHNSVSSKNNMSSRRHNPFFRSALYESSPLDFSTFWADQSVADETPKKKKDEHLAMIDESDMETPKNNKKSNVTAANDESDTESEVGRAITASFRVDPEPTAELALPEYRSKSVRFSDEVFVGIAPDVNRNSYASNDSRKSHTSNHSRNSQSSTASLRLPAVPLRTSSRAALRNWSSTSNLRTSGSSSSAGNPASTGPFGSTSNTRTSTGDRGSTVSNASSSSVYSSTVDSRNSTGDIPGSAGSVNSTRSVMTPSMTNSIDNTNATANTSSTGNTTSAGQTHSANHLRVPGSKIPGGDNDLPAPRAQPISRTVTPLSYNDYGPGPVHWIPPTSGASSASSQYSQNTTSSASTAKALRILGATPAEVASTIGPHPSPQFPDPAVRALAGALTDMLIEHKYDGRTDLAAFKTSVSYLIQNFKDDVVGAVAEEFARERAHKLALCRLVGKGTANKENDPEQLFESLMDAMTPKKNRPATLTVPKAEVEGPYPTPLTAIPASAILNTTVHRRRSPIPPAGPPPTAPLPATPGPESRSTHSPARGERISRYINHAIEKAKAENVVRHQNREPLVEVGMPNCVAPKEWPRITSLEMIRNMNEEDVANWFEFYTGREAVGDVLGQRIAVAHAVGLEVKPVRLPSNGSIRV